MSEKSLYVDSLIYLPTLHAKGQAVTQPFFDILGARVVELSIDTDALGTFSGEVARRGSQLECARRKCELALESSQARCVLSSEGSFGPHPAISFLPCNYEILYFIDLDRDFHAHLGHISTKTNYQMHVVERWDDVANYAKRCQFPSHALIVRPHIPESSEIIFKGIQSESALKNAFEECKRKSTDGCVVVETDMRAHLNPMRMAVIADLAVTFAQRLSVQCPACATPGWGKKDIKTGLLCLWCEMPTQEIKTEIFGCYKCPYMQEHGRADGVFRASPANCSYCNP